MTIINEHFYIDDYIISHRNLRNFLFDGDAGEHGDHHAAWDEWDEWAMAMVIHPFLSMGIQT
jgi:hypothetical protein